MCLRSPSPALSRSSWTASILILVFSSFVSGWSVQIARPELPALAVPNNYSVSSCGGTVVSQVVTKSPPFRGERYKKKHALYANYEARSEQQRRKGAKDGLVNL